MRKKRAGNGERLRKLTFTLPQKFFFSTSTMLALSLVLSRFWPGYVLLDLEQNGWHIAEQDMDGTWKLELTAVLRPRKRLRRNSRLARTRRAKR
jgi:hypothetical protein